MYHELAFMMSVLWEYRESFGLKAQMGQPSNLPGGQRRVLSLRNLREGLRLTSQSLGLLGLTEEASLQTLEK